MSQHEPRTIHSEECTGRVIKGIAIVRWKLFAKDISLDAEAVSMTLSMTNPLNKNVGRIYEPQEWPGLEAV